MRSEVEAEASGSGSKLRPKGKRNLSGDTIFQQLDSFFKTFPNWILVILPRRVLSEMNLSGLMVSFAATRKSYGPVNTLQTVLLAENRF